MKTDFSRKTGRSGPFFHQSGRFQGVERAKFRCRRSHLFGFSRRWPESGRFGRFSGPRGPKWKNHFWYLTQKERCCARARCTQVTLFPYDCWVFEAKTRFRPVWGSPDQNAFWETAKGHWEKLRFRLCKSPENSTGQNCRNFGGVAAVYPVFHVGGPKGPFWFFFGPGG